MAGQAVATRSVASDVDTYLADRKMRAFNTIVPQAIVGLLRRWSPRQ